MRSLDILRHEPRVTTETSLADPAVSSVVGLIDLMQSVGRVRVIVEVGSYRGVSTEVFTHFADHVVAVDHWYGQERAKRELDARFAVETSVSYLRLPSVEAAALFASGSIDLVYIDADHSEESVSADIVAWRRVVRAGGYMAGHDYLPGSGVEKAVLRHLGGSALLFADSSWLIPVRQ